MGFGCVSSGVWLRLCVIRWGLGEVLGGVWMGCLMGFGEV